MAKPALAQQGIGLTEGYPLGRSGKQGGNGGAQGNDKRRKTEGTQKERSIRGLQCCFIGKNAYRVDEGGVLPEQGLPFGVRFFLFPHIADSQGAGRFMGHLGGGKYPAPHFSSHPEAGKAFRNGKSEGTSLSREKATVVWFVPLGQVAGDDDGFSAHQADAIVFMAGKAL